LTVSLLLVASCEKHDAHSARRSKHTIVSKGAACSGAPEDRSSDDWDIYAASRQREEATPVYKYAVAHYGKSTSCAWESDGTALDRMFLRDRFVFTFPGGHHVEAVHEGPVKRTVTVEVDGIAASEAMDALHGLAGNASIDWAQAVHRPATKRGLDRTAFFQDDGKCSFGFYTKGGPEVVRLELACGE
jgi:hypothetical protein